MKNIKNTLTGVLILLAACGTNVSAEAAAQANAAVQETKKVPIIVEGKNLYYSEQTGAFYAKGDVVVIQDPTKMTAQIVKGNTTSQDVSFEGNAVYTEPGISITGTEGTYNYGTHQGKIEQANGKVKNNFVKGKDIELYADKIVLHDGTMTRCPAKVPDYRYTGDRIEIWPEDKMIIYNAKLWIKNTVIISMPKYVASLKAENSSFPRIGYDNKDGFYVKQRIEYPISDNVGAFFDANYYSKRNFKNQYGVIDREKAYTLQVLQGEMKDSDDNWIKKEPEFKLSFDPVRVGKTPISYTFNAIYGKWTDSAKTSWHQDYNLYFSHDAINLGKDLNLYLGTGYEIVKESYDNSRKDTYRYDITLAKTWSPRFSAWTAYHYIQNNTSLFSYNSDDMSREFDYGFSYKIDNKNTISYSQTYDLDTKKVGDRDYTWVRDLHCWQAAFTYRAERKEFKWDITLTRW